VGLVAGREIRQRIASRAFLVITALLSAIIIGAGVIAAVAGGDDLPPTYDVVVIGTPPAGFDQALADTASGLGVTIRLEVAPTRLDAERTLRRGDADIGLDVDKLELVSQDQPSDTLTFAVDAAWRSSTAVAAARASGLDAAQIDAIVNPSIPALVLLDLPKDNNDLGRGIGTAIGVLLFMSINFFGSAVLTGVVEEKSTGVVEVLLSQVKAHRLLAGKVFGLCALAMVQLAAMILAAVIALRISGQTIPGEVWVALPATMFWFVGGFVLYNTLFALAGSFVSRVEDAQGAAAPISLLFLAAYLAVFILGGNPESTAARVMSVLPPFAPLLMPLRTATGAASILEIVVAAVALTVAAYGMLRLAGSVYAYSLLHRGARLRWRETLRVLRRR
jgi:ABC-2 type transport system permease protein